MGGMDWHPKSGLITGHRFGWFRVWDVEAGEVRRTGKNQNSIIEKIRWSPSGDKFAIGTDGLGVWDAEGVRIGHQGLGHLPALCWLDNERIACGGANQNIVILSAESATIDRVMRVHSGQIRSLALLDDQTILSGAIDDGIRLIKMNVERPGIADVRAHEGQAVEVEWSPDGKRIATAGQDRSASVRDAFTLQESFSLKTDDGHAWVWDVAWNNHGDRLATISHLGVLKLWDAANGELIEEQRVQGLEHPRLDWRPSDQYLLLGGACPQVVDATT